MLPTDLHMYVYAGAYSCFAADVSESIQRLNELLQSMGKTSKQCNILNVKNLAPPTFLHFFLQIEIFFEILKLSLFFLL